jgi:hypothetical protein
MAHERVELKAERRIDSVESVSQIQARNLADHEAKLAALNLAIAKLQDDSGKANRMIVRFMIVSFACLVLLSCYSSSENRTRTPPNLLGAHCDLKFSAYLTSPILKLIKPALDPSTFTALIGFGLNIPFSVVGRTPARGIRSGERRLPADAEDAQELLPGFPAEAQRFPQNFPLDGNFSNVDRNPSLARTPGREERQIARAQPPLLAFLVGDEYLSRNDHDRFVLVVVPGKDAGRALLYKLLEPCDRLATQNGAGRERDNHGPKLEGDRLSRYNLSGHER